VWSVCVKERLAESWIFTSDENCTCHWTGKYVKLGHRCYDNPSPHSLYIENIRILCIKGIHGRVSIDTLDQYFINNPIDTWSTLDRHLIISRSVVSAKCQATHMHQSKISRLLTEMSMESSSRVNRGIDGVSIKCWSSVEQGYHSRVSINTQLGMPLVHMFQI